METVQEKVLIKENKSLKKENIHLLSVNEKLLSTNEKLLSTNEKLKNELLYLRRTLFGRSSERFIAQDSNQLQIAFEGMEQLPEEKQVEEAQKETVTSLLSHLLVSKYQDHLPFYRQIEIFKRNGVELAASTVNGWFSASVDLLTPLYELLRKKVLSTDYIQIDETTIPVVDKDKPGATRKGYHWIVRAPEMRKLFFHYDEGSRAQRVATKNRRMPEENLNPP
jgi:hypothetical protein